MFNFLKRNMICVIVVLLAAFNAYGIPNGMVNHWNLDEGPDWHDAAFETVCDAAIAYDSVSAVDAQLQNMDSDDWVSGRDFTCLEFDGIDDHLETSVDLSQTLGSTSSLAYWVRTTGASQQGIIGTDDIQWGGIDTAGMVTFSVDGTVAASSADLVNDGKWHYVVITRNAGTGDVKIYIDGQLSGNASGSTGDKTTVFSSIGRIENTGGQAFYFAGRLDQISVFDQVIDQAMVEQLMDNHAPKTWGTATSGTNSAAFSTESIFSMSYDPEQDTLEVVSFTQANNGSVADNGDGTFTYSADAGFTGADSFAVFIEDGNGGFSRSEMNILILAEPGPDAEKRTTTFGDFQAIQADGSDISLSGWRIPRAIDWEGDGDTDLLIGHGGYIWRYINTGSASSPVFASAVKTQAAGVDIELSGSVTIAIVDMTGDGVDDLVAVDSVRKLFLYENLSSAGQVPVYAGRVKIKQADGSGFILPDQRFDIGDWNGDSLPDVIMGTRQSEMRAYINVGSASDPKFNQDEYEVLMSGSYNLYPRLFDINRNGINDLLRGINWGDVSYWLDPSLYEGLGSSGKLVIIDSAGVSPNLHSLTDGAVVDFGDYNGDGVYDLIVGGQAGSSNVFIAFGEAITVADYIAGIEAIYDANSVGLGAALEDDGQKLLNEIKNASRGIIAHMLSATLTQREQMFDQMVAHVGKYPFLQMDAPLDTNDYHHLPSIAGQNLMTMHKMLPDTPTHRANVADAVGLTGALRDIYITTFLHVGENQSSSVGQRESVMEYICSLPREIFPDSLLTLGNYWGDGRGGTVSSFRGAKNTFSSNTGGDSSDGFRNDQDGPIEAIFGTGAYRGDYFTLVMGHEVTHSLDGYLRRCANEDLWRRKGLMMVHAGGPDIIAGSNGWIDWSATRAHFQAEGLWDGVEDWNTAWEAYWSTGSGSAWESLSFMRGNIDWFFGAPQEALATQGNQHLSHSEGRLVAAIDRWRRGVEDGIAPMKANINECVDFLDYVSAGLNKVVMYDTRGVQTPYPRADYTITHAWLERNDKGYITKITMNGHIYVLTLDDDGIVIDVNTNILTVNDDVVAAFHEKVNVFDVVANDNKLEGGHPELLSFTQPSNGSLAQNDDGKLIYTPNPGYYGTDTFDYTAALAGEGEGQSGTVTINVLADEGALLETFTGIGGDSISNLTGSSKYPDSPDEVTVVGSFEAPSGRGDSFGARMLAWLRVPATGSYTFWIASDDNGELRLSKNEKTNNNEDPNTISLIASVPGWTDPHEWDKFPEQQSVAIDLVEGQVYYIEALMKEGGGGDNFDVAWQGPGISQEVIPGMYLKPYYLSPPTFAVTPLVKTAAVEGAVYADIVAGDAIDDQDGSLSYSVVAGPLWLEVAVDGSLSGVPGQVHVGQNSFTIRATDDEGSSADAELEITVLDAFTGELGLVDFAGFAGHWLDSGCVDVPACGGADLTGDGAVDTADLQRFAWLWLADYGTDGLAGHWTFDADGSDSAGDNDGAMVGDAVVAGGAIVGGGALLLDGSGDYVEMAGYAGVAGGAARTVSAWVKTTAVDGEIVTWGDLGFAGGSWIMRTNVNGLLRVEVGSGKIVGTTAVNDGQWHHVAAVLMDDGTPNISEIQLYVDGQLETLTVQGNRVIDTGSALPVRVGICVEQGGDRYFNGLIDDVRIYERAMTAGEVGTIFNQ